MSNLLCLRVIRFVYTCHGPILCVYPFEHLKTAPARVMTYDMADEFCTYVFVTHLVIQGFDAVCCNVLQCVAVCVDMDHVTNRSSDS